MTIEELQELLHQIRYQATEGLVTVPVGTNASRRLTYIHRMANKGIRDLITTERIERGAEDCYCDPEFGPCSEHDLALLPQI